MIAAPFLPILVLIWPLTLAFIAALPRMRRHAVRLLPIAPLPALWFAFARPQEPSILPEILLGAELAAVPAGRLLLALTAALWLAAALYAQAYMKDTTKPAVFAGFWCLTLAGNLGVFLSADVVTFYMAFATVSLAAYILIVHEATAPALRAGRIYIVMVIFGEVCLLTAFVIGIAAADSLSIADIRAALSDAPLGGLAALLLVTGFGIKAGLMPLHVWLPLAHPAAPTPASAVLSGAIVKAGIIGMILFLPAGLNFADWLVALGLAGAFAGAVFGLLEINPKTILAYSTISQMSLVTALIAAAGGGGDGSEQIAFYAVHHGLAKGALFLSVGLVAASGGRWRAAILAAVVLIALSVAGAPLTGGGVVKLAAKSTLSGAAETALTLTAITTTLVLTWFVTRLALTEPDGKSAYPSAFLAAPTLTLGLAALVVPWLLGPDWSGFELGYPLHLSSLWSSAWPITTGLAAGILWARRQGAAAPARGRSVAERVDGQLAIVRRRLIALPDQPTRIAKATVVTVTRSALRTLLAAVSALEQHLRDVRNASILLVAFCIAIAVWEGFGK